MFCRCALLWWRWTHYHSFSNARKIHVYYRIYICMFFVHILNLYSLHFKDHSKNSPLELLIINPYWNNGISERPLNFLVFGLPGYLYTKSFSKGLYLICIYPGSRQRHHLGRMVDPLGKWRPPLPNKTWRNSLQPTGLKKGGWTLRVFFSPRIHTLPEN